MQTDINNFLKFGYYLDYDNDFLVSPNPYVLPTNEDFLLEEASNILENIFSKILSTNKLHDIIIPLSGGFDSRLILSYLLNHKNARDIKTYTFGTPGTYDYEIGNLIAKNIGTNHFEIDMTSIEMSIDDIIYNSKKVKSQCMLFYSTPFHILDDIFTNNAMYFSGFMGDPIAGSKLKHFNSTEDAIDVFIKENSISSFNIKPSCAFLSFEKNDLSLYENIDFHNRQSKYIKPHVAPEDNYICPFMDETYINFMFSLPTSLRNNCNFYRRLCKFNNESLFRLPLKDYSGLSIDDSKSRILLRKALNHGLSTLNTFYNFNYTDKRTNYFNIRHQMQKNPYFHKDFNELYLAGAEKLTQLGLISYNESRSILKDGKNDNDLIIIASIGAQSFIGKDWS